MDHDFAIIGAGAAGIATACRLAAARRSVLLIEASDRPGGRARTGRNATGYGLRLAAFSRAITRSWPSGEQPDSRLQRDGRRGKGSGVILASRRKIRLQHRRREMRWKSGCETIRP
ncbi:choline dehydrogenase-like flavoprotein [Phyllobacterium sp. 1468]|nr:choline dehydrogenase-like flavoprotein [Phyllobacterium sp. 1468]